MDKRGRKRGARHGWFWAALAAGGVAAAVTAVGRARPVPPDATPPAAAPAAPSAGAEAAPPPSSDYASRVVAYLANDQVVTREELGEYLIARRGAEKMDLFVNRKIIDKACRDAGVEVTAAEVDA